MNNTIIRKGFGLKKDIQETLDKEYYHQLINEIKAADYTLSHGDLTFKLAKEYGFCYGVDRSIDYAYQFFSDPTCRFIKGNFTFNDRTQINVHMFAHMPGVLGIGTDFQRWRQRMADRIDMACGKQHYLASPGGQSGQIFHRCGWSVHEP